MTALLFAIPLSAFATPDDLFMTTRVLGRGPDGAIWVESTSNDGTFFRSLPHQTDHDLFSAQPAMVRPPAKLEPSMHRGVVSADRTAVVSATVTRPPVGALPTYCSHPRIDWTDEQLRDITACDRPYVLEAEISTRAGSSSFSRTLALTYQDVSRVFVGHTADVHWFDETVVIVGTLYAVDDARVGTEQTYVVGLQVPANGASWTRSEAARHVNDDGMRILESMPSLEHPFELKVVRAARLRFERALSLDPTYATARYNAACTAARQSEADEALEHLRVLAMDGTPTAVKKLEKAKKDPDFSRLREHPIFRELTGSHP